MQVICKLSHSLRPIIDQGWKMILTWKITLDVVYPGINTHTQILSDIDVHWVPVSGSSASQKMTLWHQNVIPRRFMLRSQTFISIIWWQILFIYSTENKWIWNVRIVLIQQTSVLKWVLWCALYETRNIFPIHERHTSLFHNSMVSHHRPDVVIFSGEISKIV